MAHVKHRVLVPPQEEPLSLSDVRLHLRLIPGDDAEDDAILLPLISASREYCENITGRALAVQTIAAYPAAGQRTVILPRPSFVELLDIQAHYADGVSEVLAPSLYDVDDVDGAVVLCSPPEGLRERNPIAIRYRAGYKEVPFAVRQAMLLLVGHWYENREAVEVGAVASIEVSTTAQTLLNQYKVWWF